MQNSLGDRIREQEKQNDKFVCHHCKKGFLKGATIWFIDDNMYHPDCAKEEGKQNPLLQQRPIKPGIAGEPDRSKIFLTGKEIFDCQNNPLDIRDAPTIIDPRTQNPEQIAREERQKAADLLLEKMPQNIQLMVSDLLRENKSWKAADAFYFGIMELAQREEKK